MKVRTLLLGLVGILATLPLQAGASPVSVTDLDTDPITWDDQTVTITGEIVGDYGRRPNVVWVQVNDDGYVEAPLIETGRRAGTNTGLGVRIPKALFEESWGSPGGYRTRGPIVEVTGTFRYADTETGGDTFIDATSIELISAARPLDLKPTDFRLVAISLVGVAGGIALWGRARWKRLNPEA